MKFKIDTINLGNRNQGFWLPCRCTDMKGAQGALWNAGNILYLLLGSSYIHQYLYLFPCLSVYLRFVHFSEYMFYFNKNIYKKKIPLRLKQLKEEREVLTK